MQHSASRELGAGAQRRVALAFCVTLAVAGTTLLVLAPALIPGLRTEAPYYRSPAFFPMAALALIAVASALQSLRLLRGASLDGDDYDEPAANWPMVLVAGSDYAGYIVLVQAVGYVAGTAVFLFALGLLARLGWKLPLVLSLVLTGLLFAVFVFGLNVWFPATSVPFLR